MADLSENKATNINKRIDGVDAKIVALEAAILANSGFARWQKWKDYLTQRRGETLIGAIVVLIVSIVGAGMFNHWLEHRGDAEADSINKGLS